MSEANYGMVLISSLYLIRYYFFNIFLRVDCLVKEKRIIEEGYNNMDFINTCVKPMSYNIYILDVNDVAMSIMNPRFGGRF